MAFSNNRPDSYLPLTSEMHLLLPGQDPITIPTSDFLESIHVEVFAGGGWTGEIVLFDPAGDFLDLIVASTGINSKITFRYGFDTASLADRPLHTASISKLKPEFLPEGTRITMELVQTEVLVAVLDRQDRFFKAGLTATQIFLEIAKSRGWRISDRFNRPTVQDSRADPLEAFVYAGESDIKFIKERILPRAVDDEGNGFMFFFDVDGAAHFHSLRYRSAGTSSAPFVLQKEYTYARDSQGEVIRFAPSDDVVDSLIYGGGNNDYVAVDSSAGVGTSLLSTAQAGMEGMRLTGVAGAVYRPPFDTQPHGRINLPAREAADLDRQAQSMWSRIAAEAYTAELEVIGTHACRPNDYVSVRVLRRDGTDHPLGGVFQVFGVENTFNSSGFLTQMKLGRLGHNFDKVSDKLTVKKSAIAAPDANSTTGANLQAAPVNKGGSQGRRV